MSELRDQHYFVIRAEMNDEGEVEFVLDDDTADAHFTDGLVWGKHGEWLNRLSDTQSETDDKMREALIKRLS